MAIIIEKVGDIFSAPPKSILIHACNARGAWGSGVALAFKRNYPYAFRKYNAHCLSPPTGSEIPVKQHQADIVGTTLLIPPPNATNQRRGASKTPHYIGCLFTSLDYGNKVSPAEEILENTKQALKDLAGQVAEMGESGEEEGGKCYAVRINSGRFGVEWQKTKALLEAGDLDITVFRPEEDERVGDAGPAAGRKLGQRSVRSGGAKGRASSKAARAMAGTLDKHMVRVKRKRKADLDGDEESVHEDAKGEDPVHANRDIEKRKKLGLDK